MARRGRGEGSIYQRKDGLWAATISLGYDRTGKRRRLTLYGRSKKEVQEKLLKVQHDALLGLPVQPERVTLGQHMEAWLAGKKPGLRRSTIESYERLYRQHIEPHLGHVPLRQLDYRRIEAFYAYLESEEELGPRTIAYVAWLLRSACDDAVQKRLIPTNPVRLASRRTYRKQEARYMTPEELRFFLAACPSQRLGDMFIVGVYTGLRPGELLGLRWQDVDLAAAKLSVRQTVLEGDGGEPYIGKPKTKAGQRTISLPEPAVAALKRWRRRQAEERLKAGEAWEHTDLVFTDRRGGMLRRTNVAKRDFARVIAEARRLAAQEYEKAGKPPAVAKEMASKLFEGLSLHGLRHTHASLLIAAGVDPKTVSARLGHENITITLSTYAHLLPRQDEQAAARLEAYLAENGCSLAVVGP